ncbi:MAG TPA: hypothetical protein VIJ18_11440 [Microbacteriaceae bacterium]
MNLLDYVIDALLILLVVLQLRPTRFGARAILLPLILAAAVGAFYLRAIPTQGNDLALIVVLTLIGAALGLASGLATRVWRDDQRGVLVQAGLPAAALWILGMGARAVFQIWADGSGGDAIARFSMANEISGAATWVAALVLMALAQVVARVGTLLLRAGRMRVGAKQAQLA